MQVTIDQEREGGKLYESMTINGKTVVKDCIVGEDLITCTMAAGFMKLAHDAGWVRQDCHILVRDENWNKEQRR